MSGFVGGRIADFILSFFPRVDGPDCATAYEQSSKLETLFGPGVWTELKGRTVIDFGCGDGRECIDIAEHGARRVIGLEIRPKMIEAALARVRGRCLSSIISIATSTDEKVDRIVTLDCFEHFSHPAEVLRTMARLLLPDGYVLVSFGPIWRHPLGGHMFSVFPWAHLLFTEAAQMRWRAKYRTDGASQFIHMPEPLNQMTIRRFQRLVETSPLRLLSFRAVPIRRLRYLHNRLTREFLTSVVHCRLGLRLPR